MASIYEERVWLKHYPKGYPSDFQAPNISAIDLFMQSVSSHPQTPVIHYFCIREESLSFTVMIRGQKCS